MPDIGLDDQELQAISTRELNKLIKKRNLSLERAKEIKLRRRTLKNRWYACTSRHKKLDEKEMLEARNQELDAMIKAAEEKLIQMQQESQELNEKHAMLIKVARSLSHDSDANNEM